MGVREVLDRYPYLKHIILLWKVYWGKQTAKMNEAVSMENPLTMSGREKRLVFTFRGQELWKYIDCVLLAVTHGKKGRNTCSETTKLFDKGPPTKLQIDVSGNIDLNKLCCDFYRPFTPMLATELFYLTQFCSFFGFLFEYSPLFIPMGLWYILDKF